MTTQRTQTSQPIWHGIWTLGQSHELTRGTPLEHLGVEFTSIGEDALSTRPAARLQTAQRLGFLHGGASLALAETVGSIASQMCIDPGLVSVGFEINANHVQPGHQGLLVEATARPVHLGRQAQIWDVRVESDAGKLVCSARLTTSIQPHKS